MKELWLPVGALPGNGSNIFVSEKWETTEKILVVIQDSGPERFASSGALFLLIHGRVGVWSRQVAITESVELGTMRSFVSIAEAAGFAVILLNPNLNFCALYLSTFRLLTSEVGTGRVRASIRGSESPENHTAYVYNNVLRTKGDASLYFVCVGNGGRCLKHLVRRHRTYSRAALDNLSMTRGGA